MAVYVVARSNLEDNEAVTSDLLSFIPPDILPFELKRFQETKLHLKSLKRVERVVQSKKDGDKQRVDIGDAEEGKGGSGGQGKHQSKRQEDTRILREKIQRLRIGVKEKRLGLRRSASASKGLGGTFSATSFKTGRGRW